MTTATDQKITVTDTMTGRELNSTDVQAVLDQPHATANFAAFAVHVEDELARERWGKTLDLVLAETRQMMADANVRLQQLNIQVIRPAESPPESDPVAEAEPLKPNPYVELTQENLDAEAKVRQQRKVIGWTPDVPEGAGPDSILTEPAPAEGFDTTEALGKMTKRVPTAISASVSAAPATQLATSEPTSNDTASELGPYAGPGPTVADHADVLDAAERAEPDGWVRSTRWTRALVRLVRGKRGVA